MSRQCKTLLKERKPAHPQDPGCFKFKKKKKKTAVTTLSKKIPDISQST